MAYRISIHSVVDRFNVSAWPIGNGFNWVIASLAALLLASFSIDVANAQDETRLTPSFQQSEDTESARDDLPFRIYAQWALETFDENNDGSLTIEEMKKMKGALVEDRFDLNENGKLSFDEIVAAIRRPSADKKNVQKPPATALENSSAAKYQSYARSLIKRYDTDKDGGLNFAEIEVMRRPIPRSTDSDEDGLVSFGELFAALQRGKNSDQNSDSESAAGPTNKTATPVFVVKSGFEVDADTLATRFFEASMRKNDKNGDGKLDSKEIAIARWSSPRWQTSDTNDDKELSKEELQARYSEMFESLLNNQGAQSKRTRGRGKSNSQSVTGMADVSPMTGDDKGTLTGMVGGTLSNLPLSNPPVTPTTKKRKKHEPSSQSQIVDVKLFLFRLPVKSNPSEMNKAIEAIENSTGSIEKSVRLITQEMGIDAYDQMVFSAIENLETNLSSGASVPQVVGTTKTARGTVINQQFIDIGLMLTVAPRIHQDRLSLNLKIEKSDLISMPTKNEEQPDERIVNWSFDSSVHIKDDCPTVVGSSNSDMQWVMVIDASIRN